MKVNAYSAKYTWKDFWPVILAVVAIPLFLGLPKIMFGTLQLLIDWGII